MTTKTALKKAQSILGPKAAVSARKRVTEYNGKKLNDRFNVGKITMGFFSIYAWGMSWEEAFETLERKKAANRFFC